MQKGLIAAYNAIVGKDREKLFCKYFYTCVRNEANRISPPLLPHNNPDDIPMRNDSEGPDSVESADLLELLLMSDFALIEHIRTDQVDHDMMESKPLLRERVSALLSQAMENLPEDEREIIDRRFLCDPRETLQQVAEQMGLTIDKVRTRQSRALKTLRRAFDRFPEDLPD